MSNARALEAGTAERAKQYVKVAHAHVRRPPARRCRCPARCRASCRRRSPRASSGYLRRWTKDIGSHGRQGRAARRDRVAGDRPAALAGRSPRASRRRRAWTWRRAPSSAGKACARRTRCRSRSSTSGAAPYAQARANLAAADANVRAAAPARRLQARRRAVRRRHHAAQRRRRRPDRRRQQRRTRLFLLSQTDPLRVYVNVPQAYAQLDQAGQDGGRHAGRAARRRTSTAQVARTAASIDATTRTMQVEVTLPNRDGTLLPGAYVQVTLPLRATQSLGRSRPTRCCFAAKACASRSSIAAGRVSLRPIGIGRNFGESVEVLDGVVEHRSRWCSIRRIRWPRATRSPSLPRRPRTRREQQDARSRAGAPCWRALLAGCAAGPDYRKPALRHARGVEGRSAVARRRARTTSRPRVRGGSASATRSSTRCERQALANSPTLVAADARLAQARAVVAADASAAFIRSSASPARAARQKISANRPLTNYSSPNFSTVQNDFIAAFTVNYEVDLSGRVRRTIEGARASAEQSAADLENTRLLLSDRSRDGVLQPARNRHRARRAGALDRPAAARRSTWSRRATTSARRPASTSRSSRRCSTAR